MLTSYAWLQTRLFVRKFSADVRGNVAIIFGLSSVVIAMAAGAGIDLARAYSARQKLSEIAALTCQYAGRTSVASVATSSGLQTYINNVNAFAVSNITAQKWTSAPPAGATGPAYFTSSSTTSYGKTIPTGAVTTMNASVPTTLLRIINVSQIAVAATIPCPPANLKTGPYILQEGFESGPPPCGDQFCTIKPDGSTGATTTPVNSFPSQPAYIGTNGDKFYITGYCLEFDPVGVTRSTVPEGSHAGELDCWGNSAISSKLYLSTGNYELRYNYAGRIDYPNYDPLYVCGTTANDVAWANDSSNSLNDVRTNQVNVYLDKDTNNAAPMHTTIDGTQQLAGSNLIDVCVYSQDWIERSVRIKITTAGIYWLSFASDGANDKYGGSLDNLRFCYDTCPGTISDNFPASWLAANNGGNPKLLFEDTFESPSYSSNTSIKTADNGNIAQSLGVSPGWPSRSTYGWSAAPFNQMTYATSGAAQGAQALVMDGPVPFGSASKVVARPFVLDPGYYQLTYNYLSMVNFAPFDLCSTPGNMRNTPHFAASSTGPGQIRYGGNVTTTYETNRVAAFMASGQLVSTPNIGPYYSAATAWTNPDGSVTSTPSVPIDAYSASYDPAAVNPIIDECVHVGNWAWKARIATVQIKKSGIYWLAFSARNGTTDGYGGEIDDVKLTALGSPYMSNPPTSTQVAIPTPDPPSDSSFTNNGQFDGFLIVADPFTPPAAPQ